jgi:hypothetical protein
MLALKKAEHLSLEQLQNLQTKRFKKFLKHVLQYSRFYQWYYNKHGINIKNIGNISVVDLPQELTISSSSSPGGDLKTSCEPVSALAGKPVPPGDSNP